MVMRCEKGFVSAGFEGDGIVNPFDAGCGWAVDMDKGDFIGRRSLVRDVNVGGVRSERGGPAARGSVVRPPRRHAARGPRCAGYRTACPSATCPRPVTARTSGAPSRFAVLDDGRRLIDERVDIAAIGPARAGAGDPAVLRRPRRRADAGLSGWATGSRSPVPCGRRW